MTSHRSNVTFVLVPGSFSTPIFYDKVTPILTSQGYTFKEAPLLSAAKASSGRQPPATMQEDAAQIHSVIESVLDEGNDVVVAVHSYGGFPGTEALKGLGRAGRPPSKGTAVIGIVYIVSFLPPVGSSLRDLMHDYQSEPFKSGLPGQYFLFDGRMGPAVFNDLTDEAEIRRYVAAMIDHSSDSFGGKLSYAAYKDIPSTFILPENDLVVPTSFQHEMVELAVRDGGRVKKIAVPGAGHAVNVSRPELVAEALVDAARG